MTKIASFACGLGALLSVSAIVRADEPIVTSSTTTSSRYRYADDEFRIYERIPRGAPVAYYPTQKYYNHGTTIAYRFVPLDRSSMRRVSMADSPLLSPGDVVRGGTDPRIIVHSNRPLFRATTKVTTVTTKTESPISPAAVQEVHPAPISGAVPIEATIQPVGVETAK